MDVFMMVSVSLKNTNCLGMLMFPFAKSRTDFMSVCFDGQPWIPVTLLRESK